MRSLSVLLTKLWRFGYGAKGSLYPQGADGVEVELPIEADGKVLTTDSTVPQGMSWQAPVGTELLVEDGAMELLFDDTTGDVLYEG